MRRIVLLSLVLAPLGCDDKKPAPASTAPAATSAPAMNAGAPAAPTGAAPTGTAPAANPNDPAAQAQQALGGLLGAMGGQKPGAPPAKAVNWRDLQPLLADELAGWKADGEAKGESTQMGAFSVTEVRRNYKKDALTTELKIVDTSMNTMLQAAFNMARMANVDASDHYAKGIDIAGAPAFEEWHASNKHAKVSALVGGRFIVETQVSGVPDGKPLVELVSKLDFGKLAGLAK
jgi:hypothetical protein